MRIRHSNPAAMPERTMRFGAVCVFLALATVCATRVLHSSLRLSRAAGRRIHLSPTFTPGQSFRYSIQTRIETRSSAVGPVADMGGPKALTASIGVVIRLDVLSVSAATGALSPARIRATYEKAAATTNSASYDPDAAAMQEEYNKLSGQSVEFTLQSDGKITDIAGRNDPASDSDPSRAATLSQWLSQLMISVSLPKQGIEVGQKWTSEQPLANLPLDGLAWKTTATYVRNEACAAASHTSAGNGVNITPASAAEQCAVIMSHSEIIGGRDSKERTPEAFRQNGLRTSGVWAGATDSLTSVSLSTGLVSSVTQTGSTHMDFTIMTTHGQNRMRYAGDTRTQSDITLLPRSATP